MKETVGIVADVLKNSIEFLFGKVQGFVDVLENAGRERDRAISNFAQIAQEHNVRVNHDKQTNLPIPTPVRKDEILVRIFSSGEIAMLLGSLFLLIFIGTQWLEADLIYIILISLFIFLVITCYLPTGVAAFMEYFNIRSEIPDSNRKIYYILLFAAIIIVVGFFLFYTTRQSADLDGFYYYGYQASFVLWEIGSAIAAAALKMLRFYHNWSIVYTTTFKTMDALYRNTLVKLQNTSAQMIDEYEKFLQIPDPKPSLNINLQLRDEMENIIEYRKQKGTARKNHTNDDFLKLLK